jgi:hypothetical protein
MTNDNPEELASLNTTYPSLKPRQIEKVFNECVEDLNRILVFDGVDILADGFRVRSHDLYGQLPEIVMQNSGDTFWDKDRLGNEVCKLVTIVKLRDQIVAWLPRGEFLAPASIDGKAIAGKAEDMDCRGQGFHRGVS